MVPAKPGSGRPRNDSQEGALRYFLTFACYRCHLHGDESGSVDRSHNLPGSRVLEADPTRAATERQGMLQTPYSLDRNSQAAVLEALREVRLHRRWILLAAQVRTNHVHVIVEAEVRPERVMNDFKSYASRWLNRLGRDGPERKRWALAMEGPGRTRSDTVRRGRPRRAYFGVRCRLTLMLRIHSLTVAARKDAHMARPLCRMPLPSSQTCPHARFCGLYIRRIVPCTFQR